MEYPHPDLWLGLRCCDGIGLLEYGRVSREGGGTGFGGDDY
jgi:hypothetical protein